MAAYNNSSEDGAARDEEGYGAAYQHEYSGAPTEVPDEVGAAYVSPGTRSAAQNDTVAVYCLDCDDTPAAAPAAKRRAAADQPGASCYSSAVAAGEALPRASQVLARPDKKTTVPAADAGPGKVAGAFTERLRRGLPVLGLSVASLAVAGLATGEPNPAAGFGLFLMLIVGLSSVTIRAIGA
ncbi:hypothetical protein GQ55_6G054900 [Panicum hallii var. hallii]|uniref:Uncharacterized protein n=1 Tax=Panicum hallii var. hallii TaxID=1504633 RepID=A0A2T7D463_9POAL|nr:hypothetical protein GQ55_6G054900 [Panicum hallii var. hallii]